jgi:hypothetical protein
VKGRGHKGGEEAGKRYSAWRKCTCDLLEYPFRCMDYSHSVAPDKRASGDVHNKEALSFSLRQDMASGSTKKYVVYGMYSVAAFVIIGIGSSMLGFDAPDVFFKKMVTVHSVLVDNRHL